MNSLVKQRSPLSGRGQSFAIDRFFPPRIDRRLLIAEKCPKMIKFRKGERALAHSLQYQTLRINVHSFFSFQI